MNNELYKLRLKAIKGRLKAQKFYACKETAQTVGIGNWFSSSRSQKRIKGIRN